MIIKRYQDLDTWQLAESFRREVFKLVQESPAAVRNFTYRDQVFDSAGAPSKHIAEGFLRNKPLEFRRFLDYAISSIGETENHLQDGVELNYFTAANCSAARRLAYRCRRAALSLKRAQERYVAAQQARKAEEQRQRRLENRISKRPDLQ